MSADREPSFEEVAPRVWVAHYDWMHVNITLVGGSSGLVMVDTHASARAARRVADAVRRLGAGPLVALVNTHEHWDHTFGNVTMLQEFGRLPVHATEWAAEHTQRSAEEARRRYRETPEDPHAEEVMETSTVAADHTFSSARVIDLGDRAIELVHPGKGHTAGDLVVRVPDADVLVAGDLVEESDPVCYGDDSHPFDWPMALDLVLSLLTDTSVVVPGHGRLVDRDFVEHQRAGVGIVAETIRDLAGRGVPVSQALEEGEWPWEAARLEAAVRVGYAQLPRDHKRLPLV